MSRKTDRPFTPVVPKEVDRVYIIAGGSSLKDFDFRRLPPGLVIGCNKSAFFAPCDVFTTCDQNFARNYQERIEQFVAEGKEAYIAVPPSDDSPIIPGVHYLIRRRNSGLAKNKVDCFGVHTGMTALSLAYHFEPKFIGLLGYDMGYGEGPETHFHEGYKTHTKRTMRYFDMWKEDFSRPAAILRNEGIEVINYVGEPCSRIDHFKKVPLNEI